MGASRLDVEMKKTLLEIGKPSIVAFKVELTLEGQVGLRANDPFNVYRRSLGNILQCS